MTQEKRLILFLVLSTALLLLFSPRVRQQPGPAGSTAGDHTPAPEPAAGVLHNSEVSTATTTALRAARQGDSPTPPSEEAAPLPDPVVVRTNLFEAQLSPIGGRLQRWKIIDPRFVGFDEGTGKEEELDLIPVVEGRTARSELPLELLLHNPAESNFDDINYTPLNWEKREGDNGAQIVEFTSPDIRGFKFRKTFTFYPDSYAATLTISISNDTDARYRFNEEGAGLTITWGPGLRTYERGEGNTYFYRSQYVRPLFAGDDYVQWDDIKPSQVVVKTTQVRWAGIHSKYFLAAMAPDGDELGVRYRAFVRSKNEFPGYREKPKNYFPPVTVELSQPAFELSPGETRSVAFTIYCGPKERKMLKTAGHGFQQALFSSSWRMFRWLQFPLLDALVWLDGKLKNYGLAIIVLTLLIKIILYPVNHRVVKMNARFQARQAQLKPALDAINKKYKNDPQARGRATMELYKKHGLNPLAPMQGCIPALLMAPVFIAFYWLLAESIELRNSSFLWIRDLSQPDHLWKFPVSVPLLGQWFNLLPILMGASQVIVSTLSMRHSMSQDAFQKQFMYFFPIFFTVLLYNLPSGLVLYWTVSNVFQIFHQLITNRIIKREMEKHTGMPVPDPTG
ncbi:MAG: hypothetical protein Kow0059_14610 [Candidatus Sumerlaeia bacterium]